MTIRSSLYDKNTNNNDTYTLTNVNGTIQDELYYSLSIEDYSGSDKFNFTNVDYLGVYKTSPSDSTYVSCTYKLNKVTNSCITTDALSHDKYTFTASSCEVEDEYGDDTYTIKKLDKSSIFIDDYEGKDKLIISDEKYNKKTGVIAVSAGVGHKDSSCDLFLYDTKSGGFACIENFYTVDSSSNINKAGDHCIETVKIGNKTVDMTDATFINELNFLNSEVASWLSKQVSFSTVEDVFTKGDEADITSLVQIFQGVNG